MLSEAVGEVETSKNEILRRHCVVRAEALRYGVLQNKGIYARMARILRNCGNEERNTRLERVVTQKNTNVYLETMETTENKGKEPDKARNARMESVSKRKHTKRLLGCCR